MDKRINSHLKKDLRDDLPKTHTNAPVKETKYSVAATTNPSHPMKRAESLKTGLKRPASDIAPK
jgi:hypothetical protein